jgi:HSP20 family protein
MAFKDYRDIIRQMEREMQQMQDEAFRGFFDFPVGGAGRFWQPPVDIHETDGHLVVKMELAGARSTDLQVSLSPDDRVLTITGARAEPHADREGRIRCHQLETYFGPFERAVGLPNIPINRDQITAAYKDGFLQIMLPKRVVAEKPKKRMIPITNDYAQSREGAASIETKTQESED